MMPRATAFVSTLLVVLALAPVASSAPRGALRVCADPNNMPFSNRLGEGLENALAELVARALGDRVEYTWWPQRRGFIRNTLNAGRCDVVMGVPADYELALTTRPYYRSTYVFVTRRDEGPPIRSFDDRRLRSLAVGVHVIGDDYANAPPAHALAARGMIANVVGYSIYGDYRDESPPSRLVRAVARSEIDVAIAWGPLAGFYAKRSDVPLAIARPASRLDAGVPLAFDIAMAVRKGDHARKRDLERVLLRQQRAIRALLDVYGVPRLRRR